ncbi:MAG TPA: preprotein translocase subunit SecY [Candidatus Eremiobacteraeota bacterium]|nr:MAG: preprotein translocase subunit SecY [bacterium ADurb.Bin363]HPZ08174.1 preprotein translocase subunit SecY [Candidatus Eremiobacteraeota bacterium]
MLSALISAFKVPDIRKRILFVFAGFAVFIFTVHVTVPGINRELWEHLLSRGNLGGFLGMFTGGALNKFSICAMGITPYINASIIMQLLTIVVPQLEKMAKEEGEAGRKKISQITRYLTIGLAFLQSTTMTLGLAKFRTEEGQYIFKAFANSISQGLYYAMVIVSLTAGTAFLMWLGEQMSDKGIGNGVSLIIFIGIVLRLPHNVVDTFKIISAGELSMVRLIMFIIVTLGLITSIILITQGQRRVPVQYAKRVVGRKLMGGQSTYIPIRVNNAGVISIIFAISILYFPMTILGFFHEKSASPIINWVINLFHPSSVFYNLLYFGLVVFFTYFYAAVTFNIMDISDNMKKYGGFIPGIRPGPKTAQYLEKILSRLTFVSAIFLGLIAVLPTYILALTKISWQLGSTSLLIVVGVALEFMQQIEARLVMRHYQGFMK